jgi:Flp pilus assembly protein TadD
LRKIGNHGGVDAVELECQILTAGRRAAEAASCYQRLALRVSTEPAKNSAVLLALARNQAWAGRSQDATRSYENYLQTRPDDRAATIELIRLSRYRGDYARAEKLCNRLLETSPADAEVLALKAEVLHWAGHRKITARRSAVQAATLEMDL